MSDAVRQLYILANSLGGEEQDILEAAADEIAAMRHDLESYKDIANAEAVRAEELQGRLDRAVAALRDLLADTQHADHDCGDSAEHCPVLRARAVLAVLAAAQKEAG